MILQHARLFDGTGKIWKDATIRIDGNRIESVTDGAVEATASSTAMSQKSRILDLAGKTVIPGLINCHTHLCLDGSADPAQSWAMRTPTENVLVAARHAERTLRAGVTTVRDLGGMELVDTGLKRAIQEGLLQGPRMLVSGKVICMTGGHGWGAGGYEADGVDEVRKGARQQLKAGADVIKVMATGGVMTRGVEPGSHQLSYEELRAAVEEAEKAGKLTATHAQGTAGIKAAVRAGIDSIEHGFFLDEEAIEMMLEKGTYFVPTLAALYCILEAGPDAGIPDFMIEKSKRCYDAQLDSFARALQAGVPVATGNDGGTPFNTSDNLAAELERMVAAGMSPTSALLAATRIAARLLRMDSQIGTVEAGKLADLIVLSHDPVENISHVREVEQVIQNGESVFEKG